MEAFANTFVPDIIPAACGHPGQLLPAWPAAECAWVPAYIAYGLLENLSLEQSICPSKANPSGGRNGMVPKDQELHQQMLQKLALHLAAQPGIPLLPESERNLAATKAPSHVEQARKANESRCKSFTTHDQELQRKNLSAPDQEFQQEMLRKLALHLAAQDLQAHEQSGAIAVVECKDEAVATPCAESKDEAVATPEVFPSTPSSFGEEHCEHFFIGDQGDAQQGSRCCWPASSHLVSVPLSMAHGLLGLGRGQDGHELHQQMLQKLALHLAAQSEDENATERESSSEQSRAQTSSSKPKVLKLALHLASQSEVDNLAQVESSSEQSGAKSSSFKPKVLWADTVDDDSLDPIGAATRLHGDGSNQVSSNHDGKKDCYSAPSFAKVNASDQQQFQQEMLRRLALHLAALPEMEDVLGDGSLESVELARALGESKARCAELLAELEPTTSCSQAARAAEIVDWLLPGVRTFSLTQSGCRLVQQVIDVSSVEQSERIVELLFADAEGIEELFTSPHANHVIAKIIMTMSSKKLVCIGEAVRGKATMIARHQFGSRILERLIEYSSEGEIGFLFDELLEDCEALARHPFGNFVVARMLEHGIETRKETCVQNILPYVLQHATHKTACNIVQRIMETADLAGQASIADAFLAGTGDTSLEAIAATRYGSFVIQHLVDKFHPRIDAVKARVKAAHKQLQQSGFSQRKIVRFLGEGFFRD